MKTIKYAIYVVCLAVVGLAQGEPDGLPEFPGAEYRTNRRILRAITQEDLVEGSPVWVAHQMILYSKKMDFDALAQFQSPAAVRNAKQNTPEQMEALLGGVRLDDSVKIGDAKEDGNRYYVYLVFTREDGRKRSFYEFFLKVNGRRLSVTSSEWKSGELLINDQRE